MAKKRAAKENMLEEIDNFSDMFESPYEESESMATLMTNVLEANFHHMQIAVDLTKIIVDKKTSSANITNEQVFDTYKQALKVVSDSSLFQRVMDKMD